MLKIKDKIKKMKCMEGIILYRKYKKDENFKELVKSYNHNNIILFERENFIENPKDSFYYIKFEDLNSGFFAFWLWGLQELFYADKFHLISFIDWSDKNPYYEEEGVDGIKNPFEYYFKQITSHDLLEDKNEYKILNARVKMKNSYKNNQDLSNLVEINKKYMKLREDVEEKITSDINELLKHKKTLAVHIRGVEWGNIKNHPIPLGLDKYVEQIDKALEQENFEQIFLATDSDDTIDYMSNKYSGKIVFYKDVARASKGSTTLAIFDSSIQRENNHYLLGLEVLRDMMTLASCDGLIAGLSNISLAAEITKLSGDKEYLYKHIFEQKINQKGITASKAVEKMKRK